MSVIEKQVIALNNNGAHCILQKNYDEAIDCFRSVMNSLKRCLHEWEKDRADCFDQDMEVEETSNLKLDFRDQESLRCPPRQQQQDDPNATFVFKCVIVISKLEAETTSVVPSDLSRLAIVSMYNLALATHLRALERQCPQQLKRALHYYEFSYKLQMQQHAVMSCVHAMSVMNNIGTIHWLLNDRSKSKMCFQRLLSTMAYLKETGGADSMDQTLIGFWSNVIGLMLRNPCTAGAA